MSGDRRQMSERMRTISRSDRTAVASDATEISRAGLLAQLPDELKKSGEARFLLVHLIYRPRSYEREFKDYEFSWQSMQERWRASYQDTVRTLRHPEVLERAAGVHGGVFVFDYARDD